MNVNFIIYVIIFLLPLKVFAECNFNSSNYINELNNPKNINRIDILIPKAENYIKNFVRIKIATLEEEIIPKKLKKNFFAKIKINYKFGNCEYTGKVRQNGDWPDHIKLENGNPIRSLDVRLNEGNILNSVRFKLLIPETRNNQNEILGSLIIKELGFIAPETFEIQTKVNGVYSLMIFQEKSEKELLEKNNRREGPIFEGDENLLWKYKNFDLFKLENISLAKLLNENWFMKGSSNEFITISAFQKLQNAYLEYSTSNESFDTLIWPNSKKNFIFMNYHLLLDSLNGWHALRPHNRKFYYNNFLQSFEPIYYDGMLNLSEPLILNNDFYYKSQLPMIDKFISILSDQNFKTKLYENYKSRVILADDDFYQKSLYQIVINLKKIKKNITNESKKYNEKDNNQKNRKIFFERNKEHNLKQLVVEKILKINNSNKYTIKGVSTLNNKSFKKKISNNDFIKILSNNSMNNQRTVFLPKDEISIQQKILNKNFLNGEIFYTESLSLKILEEEKIIEIEQEQSQDWILFSNLILKDWKILFSGKSASTENKLISPMNYFGMTGCINFYNVDFNNIKFDIKNGKCEDSLNIVKSYGQIDKINITSAFSDALDIDFSNIKIKDVMVNSAGNDCADFSGGQYEINNFVLTNCTDKAVSVGEKSHVTIHEILITNADIGLATKDSSISYVNNAIINETNSCLSAYNKKQEFFGGLLFLKYSECNGNLIDNYKDRMSDIILNYKDNKVINFKTNL